MDEISISRIALRSEAKRIEEYFKDKEKVAICWCPDHDMIVVLGLLDTSNNEVPIYYRKAE